jgi:hypothetical protein
MLSLVPFHLPPMVVAGVVIGSRGGQPNYRDALATVVVRERGP